MKNPCRTGGTAVSVALNSVGIDTTVTAPLPPCEGKGSWLPSPPRPTTSQKREHGTHPTHRLPRPRHGPTANTNVDVRLSEETRGEGSTE